MRIRFSSDRPLCLHQNEAGIYLLRLMFIGILFFKFSLCDAQFVLYNSIHYPGMPSTYNFANNTGNYTPYLKGFILDYGASVGGSSANTCTPNPANIQQYATEALKNPSWPVSFDMEINPWPTGGTALADSVNNYISAVNLFKNTNPNSPISFYGLPPYPNAWRWSGVSGSATFQNVSSSAAYVSLANAVDYFSPSLYAYSTDDTVTWRKYADTVINTIRKYYSTTKPIYPYIWPQWHDDNNALMDTASWYYELNYLYNRAQGAIIWSGGTYNWNGDAAWWQTTKKFMARKGLIPPVVADSFYIKNSSLTGNPTLRWLTSTDTVTQYFQIEKSTDNVNYSSASGQIAKSGGNYTMNAYEFTDTSPNPTNVYYRLKSYSTTGITRYLDTIQVAVFKSAGTGVTVDLSSSVNWLENVNGTWVAADTAPASLNNDLVYICSNDTWSIASATAVGTGVIVIDSATALNATASLQNRGKIIFCGTAAQTIPGTANLSGGTWGTIEVNNTSGVTATQSSASNFMRIGKLTLTSGTFTASASGGKSVSLYVDSTVTTTGGNFTVANSGGTNYGPILDAKSTQRFASGTFLNNTIYALTISNPTGFTYDGSLTISNNLHISLGATVNVSGDVSVGGLSIDTLTSTAPLQSSGGATITGILTIGKFSSTPNVGQTLAIVQSANGISGNFTTVTLPAGYTGTTSAQGNNLILTITGTPNEYLSAGTGVSVDLSSATNWLVYQSGSWVAASSAPSSLNSGTVVIQSPDTWVNASAATINAGVIVVDSAATLTASNTLRNNGKIVFAGKVAQTVPGASSLYGGTWGTIEVNNNNGVTSTQSSASSFMHIGKATLTSGTFTATASVGKSVSLYIDSSVTASGGNLNIINAATNYGFFLDGKSTQSFASGTFLNNTVYALFIQNSAGFIYNGPLTISNNLHISFASTVNVSGNLSLNGVTLDTLTIPAPVQTGGSATVTGVLSVGKFRTVPYLGQTFIIVQSASGISGNFSSVTLPSGYTGATSVRGNNLILTITAAPKGYKSAGTGVSVDISSKTNWLTYQSGSWMAATSAPSSLDSGGIVIQAGDTWNNASTVTIPATVTIVQQGNTGTFATSGNLNIYNSSLVYSGTSAQTIPSPTAFSSRTVSNLTIDNAAGVTLNAGSYFNIRGTLTLTSGNLVTYGGSGLYIYGQLVRTGGSINFPGGIGFDGSTAQTVPDSVINNSYTYINNAAGVTALPNIKMDVTTLALQKGNLTLSNDDSLNISNSIVYSAGGIVSAPASVVAFTGTAAQSVPSGTFINNSVNNLFINNTQGVSATGNLSVQNLDVAQFNPVTPLTVSGTATVAGSLTIDTIQSGVSTDTIVSAGSVSGAFSSLDLPAGYTGSLTYTSSAVILNVSQSMPMAIRSVALTGNAADNTTSLNWKVVGNNVKYFEVQRSADGVHFATLSTVGASIDHFVDNIHSENYYRVIASDNIGNTLTSNVLNVNANISNAFTIFPNPANNGSVTLSYAALTSKGEIRILNMNGSIVLREDALQGTSQKTLDVSKLPGGTYFVVLIENGKRSVAKLIVR